MQKITLLIGVLAITYISYNVGKLVGENKHVDDLRKKLEELTKE